MFPRQECFLRTLRVRLEQSYTKDPDLGIQTKINSNYISTIVPPQVVNSTANGTFKVVSGSAIVNSSHTRFTHNRLYHPVLPHGIVVDSIAPHASKVLRYDIVLKDD